MKRTFTKKPILASQEKGTTKTYRNKRNSNKYIEVKKGNDGHSYARQYMEWDTPEGKVKNYTGAKDPKRGRYSRARLDTIDQMLDDYDEVTSATPAEFATYVFYFGDGNSAASRGTDVEHDCVLHGKLSCDEMAALAIKVLNDLPDNFNGEDVLDILRDEWDYDEEEIAEMLEDNTIDDAVSYLDISGGDPLVYKVEKNGQEIFYDEYMEEEVRNCSGYDDDSVGYRVYEIDEDEDELDCIDAFDSLDEAINFAEECDCLTHVVEQIGEDTEVVWSSI